MQINHDSDQHASNFESDGLQSSTQTEIIATKPYTQDFIHFTIYTDLVKIVFFLQMSDHYLLFSHIYADSISMSISVSVY